MLFEYNIFSQILQIYKSLVIKLIQFFSDNNEILHIVFSVLFLLFSMIAFKRGIEFKKRHFTLIYHSIIGLYLIDNKIVDEVKNE